MKSGSRPPARGIAACALAVLLSSPTACDRSTPAASDPKLVERGRAVYNFRCYYCHGYSGDAKTLAATYLSPAPANFIAARPADLSLERIRQAVTEGRAGTAMKPFAEVIPAAEIEAVSAFVFDTFVVRKAENTRYHMPENGWPNHERYRAAYPFATGEVSLAEPAEKLSQTLQGGRRLYLESCVSCHDRGKPAETGPVWDSRPLSYPRFNYDHRKPEVDAATSATPYRLHDVPPRLAAPNPALLRGERVYQDNCAFCHAADGTGKNWIGAFLEPHPRNLTDPAFMSRIDRTHLRRVIRDGLPNTSMPAWKTVLGEPEIEDLITYIDAAFHPVR